MKIKSSSSTKTTTKVILLNSQRIFDQVKRINSQGDFSFFFLLFFGIFYSSFPASLTMFTILIV